MSSFGLLTLQGEGRDHGRRGSDRSGGERSRQPLTRPQNGLERWRQILGPLTPITRVKEVTDAATPVNIPVTMKVLFLAAHTLRSCHHLLHISPSLGEGADEGGDQGKGENSELPPSSLCMALKALLPWMRQIIPLLYQLAPSQAQVLDANCLVQLLGLSRPQNDDSRRTSLSPPVLASGIGSLGGSSDDLDAIPLAYDARRDSRTRQSDRQPHLHANQQRTRDQLHAWIRGVSRWRPAQAASAGFELMAGVHDENLGWFAELLLSEYEQLERHQTQRASRLERLEVRLTTNGAQGSVSLGENPVILLVRMVDSLRLTVVLQSLLFSLIEDELLGSLEQDGGGEGASTKVKVNVNVNVNINAGSGANPNLHIEPIANRIIDVSSLVERLMALGRLLATCVPPVIGQYDDPVLCFMRDLLIGRANARHQLIVTLPLAGSLLRAGPPSLSRGLRPVLQMIRRRERARISSVRALRQEKGMNTREGHRPNPKVSEGEGGSDGGGNSSYTIMLRLLLEALLEGADEDEDDNNDDNAHGTIHAHVNDADATHVGEEDSVAGDSLGDWSPRSASLEEAQDALLRNELILNPHGLEFVLGRIISDFKRWQGELALCCSGMAVGLPLSAINASGPASSPSSSALNIQAGGSAMGAAPSSSSSTRPPRKVRPVTAAPEAAQVQRRLRQWFWWQWSTFRNLGLALLRYLQGEGYSQAAAARLLWSLLPPLLPEALRQAPEPMLRLVISLLLEEYIEGDNDNNNHDDDGDDTDEGGRRVRGEGKEPRPK